MLRSKAICLLFVIVTLSTIALGRRYPKHKSYDFESDNRHDVDDISVSNNDEDIQVKTEGGTALNSVFEWHGTGWIYKSKPSLITHLIRVGKDYVLAPLSFAGRIGNSKRRQHRKKSRKNEMNSLPNTRSSEKGANWVFPTPVAFNASKGIQADPNYDGLVIDTSTFTAIASVANRFQLFNQKWGFGEKNPNPDLPTLETDKNKGLEDCYLYAWSQSPTNPKRSSHSKSSSRALNRDYRTYSRYKVSLDTRYGCNNGECELFADFTDDRGKLCLSYGDVLAPVLCGPNKKLTYLTYNDNEGVSSGCSMFFKAVHTAYIIGNIRHHVPDLRT